MCPAAVLSKLSLHKGVGMFPEVVEDFYKCRLSVNGNEEHMFLASLV